MLWLLILEDIFKRTVRPWFAEIFWCHCHLQWQICFGLADGQDREEFSNIAVSLGCSRYFYTRACRQMTSGADLCHRETSKLISETNRWTGLYTIQFLSEVRSETMLHYWCWSGKYTTVLCFGIRGGDSRVPCPFYTWRVEVFWSVLWCAESLREWIVFFILVQVRSRDVKNMP